MSGAVFKNLWTLSSRYRNSILGLGDGPAGLSDSQRYFIKFAISQNLMGGKSLKNNFCHKLGRLHITVFFFFPAGP